MISENQREALVDIFTNTENLSKITLSIDRQWRRITIVYDKLDGQWYEELLAMEGEP